MPCISRHIILRTPNLFQSNQPRMRLSQMASHLQSTPPPPSSNNSGTTTTTTNAMQTYPTLSSLPKAPLFTTHLPPDPRFPTPAASHAAPRSSLLPALVKGALFTFVRPTPVKNPALLAVSPAALRDLRLHPDAVAADDFLSVLSGNRILGWEGVPAGCDSPDPQDKMAATTAPQLRSAAAVVADMRSLAAGDGSGGAAASPSVARKPDNAAAAAIYPYAQAYGGYQFGQWASQLGDGRAHSLFTTSFAAAASESAMSTAPTPAPKPTQYEVQLKGAGRTPYSRFADGRAVLRSSIREFLASEALHALGVRTTRALCLVRVDSERVVRERVEPGAIVARMAESWVRFGTFDLLHARGDRALVRRLADYVGEQLYGGWEGLAAPDETEVEDGEALPVHNRYARLFRAIVRRQAETVARWQAVGFVNGVLNTDNTSIVGLSMDFGPFAFIDVFDPAFTPNHDDHSLRYALQAQPAVIWWNLVRLGEALGELMGAGDAVDDAVFRTTGVTADQVPVMQERAEKIIALAGVLFQAEFESEYEALMAVKLGLKTAGAGVGAGPGAAAATTSHQNADVDEDDDDDFSTLLRELLGTMKEAELDYNHTLRRLGAVKVGELATHEGRREVARRFFRADMGGTTAPIGGKEAAVDSVAEWLDKYREKVVEVWGEAGDTARKQLMDSVNPNFVLRNWVCDEVIERVEKKNDEEILQRILHMALNPFKDSWDWDASEEARFTGEVPKYMSGTQCSCSS